MWVVQSSGRHQCEPSFFSFFKNEVHSYTLYSLDSVCFCFVCLFVCFLFFFLSRTVVLELSIQRFGEICTQYDHFANRCKSSVLFYFFFFFSESTLTSALKFWSLSHIAQTPALAPFQVPFSSTFTETESLLFGVCRVGKSS